MGSIFRLACVLLAAFAASCALADPPARVGRLAFIENAVSLRLDENDEVRPANINWPVSNGAMLESSGNGRAEVWVGATAFRLDGNSRLAFPVIDDRQINARLEHGSLAVSILEPDQVGEISVDTPDGQIRFAAPGRYRIDILPDRTELSTHAGQARFISGRQSLTVDAGQRGSTDSNGRMRIESGVTHDSFDNWVATRENLSLPRQAERYVAPAMTGYQDLDRYGDWQAQSEYGAVWYPRAVASDWAPYRFGRWAWIAPWGWTWIDQSPWGFAPFHYGRWVSIRGRWGWVPGAYVPRPVYAPALVGWVGNPGWNARFSFGSAPAVGWFPLAPREVYVPSFRASSTYVRQINVSHVNSVTLIDRAIRGRDMPHYANRDLPHALTMVPTSHLHGGRPVVAGELGRHDRREQERAPLSRTVPGNTWQTPGMQAPSREERRHRDNEVRPPFIEPSSRPPVINETAHRELQPPQPPSSTPEPVRLHGNFSREAPPPASPPSGQALPRNPPPSAQTIEPTRIEARPPGTQTPPTHIVGDRPWDRREERGQAFRDNMPPSMPAAREAQREEQRRLEMMQRRARETAPPFEQARPREIPMAIPTTNAPQIQRNPPPTPAMPMQTPTPMREMPRVDQRGPEPQRGGNHDNREQHRPPRGDERGPR
ncbi:MAG: hypothetical protein D3M94_04750 [Rhodocyclales bacterium GT-UBC]|nr:MAG: hypothetical protein D3M94_04750 [Rhodocyclales bacterium GT-UBC]